MTLKIALAQTNFLVGDIAANVDNIARAAIHARDELGAEMIVFPELSLTGYPAEDLLLRADFITEANNALYQLADRVEGIALIVGFPERDGDKLYNSAAVLHQGAIVACYRKRALPNYGVFDEQRYFTAGNQPCVFEFNGTFIGLTICEDVWRQGIIEDNKEAGAELLLTLNASPFNSGKIHQREAIICSQVKAAKIPLVYVNQVGGQDELIFDGASFVVDADGEVVFRAEEFKEQLSVVEFDGSHPAKSTCAPLYNEISSEYQALVLGIKDYVRKNGFQGAILGLSGGIDSALVLALAVDALGADKVEAVLLPSRYTQDMSNEDAVLEAKALGVHYHTIPIEPAVNAFTGMLADIFAGTAKDATEENIQARCRGVILMALSNKQGKLLLTTGNKSEMSVGYATLYGDMSGGFAPIKDVPKLLVYRLARYRNTLSQVIPERVIIRPPSAELAPDQVDADSLPPYDVLDPILERYIERDQSADQIIAAGFRREDVARAISLVDRNEYKRRQSPPGIRITSRAFGRDRRYPITSGYRGIKSPG
ncbi:MAG: NAD+ synthase [Methylobacter tundripaludum]|uniref:Glutamine-dependent NAD(+) synthetase n=1 Tax=Methylobacter tundripaludum TaxID=173365 RepID=A0A2S6H8H2_9GAMM|nr:NAD+ synthase [Methylobacter tundripaludum]MCK9637105.1 NAD+ synthase [Methylobacter tundripaludum]PPK73706.1 NAD+ synthase (glutamine-hydrolysing) [Methylobacter tundripaludum]